MSGAAVAARRRRVVDAMGLGPLWVLRSPTTPDDAPDRAASIAAMDRDALAEAVATCRACALYASRTHAVFGDGAPDAQWVVVGGAPSADDDAAAAPFTGPPGRLLDAMLAAVDHARRRDAFVTTAVKCRPPDDRAPSSDELAACRPFLDRQIVLASPRLLLAMGNTASRAIGADRGAPHAVQVGDRPIAAIATHDPATLLAEPHRKAEAWADLCAARSV